MTSPFRNVVDSDYEVLVHIRLRWKKTVVFMEPMESAVRGLDIGDRSAFTTELEVFFGCPFDSTDLDLDTERLNGQYDIVTCLDVIEYLFNPLHCLLQIKQVLAPGGRLYLSTPRYKPHFLWSPHHFHEMSSRSVRALFDRAGVYHHTTDNDHHPALVALFHRCAYTTSGFVEPHLVVRT